MATRNNWREGRQRRFSSYLFEVIQPRAFSYEPSKSRGLARSPGRILFSVHMKVSARLTRIGPWSSRNQKMEHKLASFSIVVALCTAVTLLIKLIRIFLNTYKTKTMLFLLLCCESEAVQFVKKVSSQSPGWRVQMGKFSSRSPRSR